MKFVATLPHLHRDPFDRLMIAQALQHDLTLVTLDGAIRAYAVPLLPAS
jgi:PIN domain nuclease of toxin-antitoxin system